MAKILILEEKEVNRDELLAIIKQTNPDAVLLTCDQEVFDYLKVNKEEPTGGGSKPQVVSLEQEVTAIIHDIGIPAHIKGYHYVRQAILLSFENPEMINSITKLLYPTVAEENKTTPNRVERAIRHAIEKAWFRGNEKTINQLFGYTVHSGKGKPTNSEFIALLVDNLRISHKNKIA